MIYNDYPTSEQFKEWMERLKKLIDNDDKIAEGINLLTESKVSINGWHVQLETDLLKAIMKDNGDWISWYIFEKNWGKNTKLKCFTKNKRELKSKTISDLYNLIIMED